MSELEVRIVKLEPMRVASAYGFGDSPEGIAGKKMYTFARAKGLLDENGSYRSFGFNNPDPSPGSPNYGYEIWVPVGPDVKAENDIRIVDFKGGLYAVTRFEGLSNMGDVWRQLVRWRENSHYKKGHHRWLENLLNPTETDPDKLIFDLYLSIVE